MPIHITHANLESLLLNFDEPNNNYGDSNMDYQKQLDLDLTGFLPNLVKKSYNYLNSCQKIGSSNTQTIHDSNGPFKLHTKHFLKKIRRDDPLLDWKINKKQPQNLFFIENMHDRKNKGSFTLTPIKDIHTTKKEEKASLRFLPTIRNEEALAENFNLFTFSSQPTKYPKNKSGNVNYFNFESNEIFRGGDVNYNLEENQIERLPKTKRATLSIVNYLDFSNSPNIKNVDLKFSFSNRLLPDFSRNYQLPMYSQSSSKFSYLEMLKDFKGNTQDLMVAVKFSRHESSITSRASINHGTQYFTSIENFRPMKSFLLRRFSSASSTSSLCSNEDSEALRSFQNRKGIELDNVVLQEDNYEQNDENTSIRFHDSLSWTQPCEGKIMNLARIKPKQSIIVYEESSVKTNVGYGDNESLEVIPKDNECVVVDKTIIPESKEYLKLDCDVAFEVKEPQSKGINLIGLESRLNLAHESSLREISDSCFLVTISDKYNSQHVRIKLDREENFEKFVQFIKHQSSRFKEYSNCSNCVCNSWSKSKSNQKLLIKREPKGDYHKGPSMRMNSDSNSTKDYKKYLENISKYHNEVVTNDKPKRSITRSYKIAENMAQMKTKINKQVTQDDTISSGPIDWNKYVSNTFIGTCKNLHKVKIDIKNSEKKPAFIEKQYEKLTRKPSKENSVNIISHDNPIVAARLDAIKNELGLGNKNINPDVDLESRFIISEIFRYFNSPQYKELFAKFHKEDNCPEIKGRPVNLNKVTMGIKNSSSNSSTTKLSYNEMIYPKTDKERMNENFKLSKRLMDDMHYKNQILNRKIARKVEETQDQLRKEIIRNKPKMPTVSNVTKVKPFGFMDSSSNNYTEQLSGNSQRNDSLFCTALSCSAKSKSLAKRIGDMNEIEVDFVDNECERFKVSSATQSGSGEVQLIDQRTGSDCEKFAVSVSTQIGDESSAINVTLNSNLDPKVNSLANASQIASEKSNGQTPQINLEDCETFNVSLSSQTDNVKIVYPEEPNNGLLDAGCGPDCVKFSVSNSGQDRDCGTDCDKFSVSTSTQDDKDQLGVGSPDDIRVSFSIATQTSYKTTDVCSQAFDKKHFEDLDPEECEKFDVSTSTHGDVIEPISNHQQIEHSSQESCIKLNISNDTDYSNNETIGKSMGTDKNLISKPNDPQSETNNLSAPQSSQRSTTKIKVASDQDDSGRNEFPLIVSQTSIQEPIETTPVKVDHSNDKVDVQNSDEDFNENQWKADDFSNEELFNVDDNEEKNVFEETESQ